MDQIIVKTTFDADSFLEAMLAFGNNKRAQKPLIAAAKIAAYGAGLAGLGAAIAAFIKLGLQFEIQDSHFVAVVLGALLMLVICTIQGQRFRKMVLGLARETGRRNDPQTFRFDAKGLRIDGQTGTSTLTWAAITDVATGKSGTIVCLGATNLPVPHKDLPEGVDPARFAAQLSAWKNA